LANHWPSTFNIWLRKISTLQSAAMNSAQNTADCLEDYCKTINVHGARHMDFMQGQHEF